MNLPDLINAVFYRQIDKETLAGNHATARLLHGLREEIATKTKPCNWRQDEDGVWDTECNNLFILNEGGPTFNGFKFCPYCGGSLTETPYTENDVQRTNETK